MFRDEELPTVLADRFCCLVAKYRFSRLVPGNDFPFGIPFNNGKRGILD
jgi:hypothetical protein